MTQVTESQFRGFVLVTVVLAGLLAYGNSFTGEFVWDDASSVLLHRHVQDPHEFFQLFREDQHKFGRGQGNFYRPLVSASFMLDYAMAGPESGPALDERGRPRVSPFLFHLTNTLWHIAAAGFLFALLVRLGTPRSISATVPLLYVVHPLHTEAVTYISGRADPMAAALMLAGLWISARDRTGARDLLASAAMLLCFIAALFCKESAAIFPVLLLIVASLRPAPADADCPASLFGRRLIPVAGAFALLGVYAYLRTGVLRFGMTSTAASSSFGQRLLETGQALTAYVKLLLVPTHLHMERTLDGMSGWTAWLGFGLLVAGVAGAVWAYRARHRRIVIAVGIFVASWLPVSGLFPLNAPMAEHWMYVPMAGFLWAVMECLHLGIRSPRGRAVAGALALSVVMVYLVLTGQRNLDWRTNERLYVATLEENPSSSRVHFNLAVTYQDLLHNLPGAAEHYKSVLMLAHDRKGETAGAKTETFTDEELESLLSLGTINLEQGAGEEAAQYFQRLLALEPTESTKPVIGAAALGLGKCYLAIGNVEQAVKTLQVAVQLRPDVQTEVRRLLLGEFYGPVL